MKIKSITGCNDTSFITVDNVETVNMDKEAVKDVIKKLIDRIDNLETFQSILRDLVENQGESEKLGYCNQCGHCITEYTLEI